MQPQNALPTVGEWRVDPTALLGLAEGVRFELTREHNPLPVFKTGALNHSATLPDLQCTRFSVHRHRG